MQKQLIGGKAYGYKQQVKHIDRNSICIMDVYYLHFQYYHAGIEWGTLCSGNHYLCECVYYFFMLLLAAFTEYQKNGGQREVFKMDTFLPDRWYCCIYSCRVYCFTCIERNWNEETKYTKKVQSYQVERCLPWIKYLQNECYGK